MTHAHWPLFDAFPALAPVLAPVALCALPTPLEALSSPVAHAGARLFIKRDDVTHPRYGGNKMRKLELVAAEWQRRGARRIVTFGGTGTNAGVAASMVAKELGVACEVLTFDQPHSSTVDTNAAAMRANGARVRHVGSIVLCALAWYAHPRRLDPKTYFLFAGCSNPVAVFGYVNAAFELKRQIEERACPGLDAPPAEIYVAAGTAATLAGLTLGCALAGLPTRVIGVRVAPARVLGVASCTAGVTAKMMRGCLDTIVRHGGDEGARLRGFALPAPVMLDAWYGPGYGATTPATDDAVAAARTAGATLEQTYTGKAFAAFLARARTPTQAHERAHDGDGARPLLFWNTFSAH